MWNLNYMHEEVACVISVLYLHAYFCFFITNCYYNYV